MMKFIWTTLTIVLFVCIFKNLAHATAHIWMILLELALVAFTVNQIVNSSFDDEDDDE